MILTHGANSLQRGVEIGGRIYRTVKIGTQTWLAENLDFKFSGCEIGAVGSPNTPAAWYYNNDEATYGIDGTRKCGLLYNWYAIKFLEDNKSTLCPGWHVPTLDEFIALATAVGGASTAGTKLKALDGASGDGWPSGWNGTDDYGFTVLPAGRRHSGSFYNLDVYALLWVINEYSSTEAYSRTFTSAALLVSGNSSKTYAYSVRLVKDSE